MADHKMCVLIFSTNVIETFFIPKRNEWDVVKMYIGLHVKYLLILSDFNETWIFSTDFLKIFKCQISLTSYV
jgi:uncharacterized protein YozE (UPF0346 family)